MKLQAGDRVVIAIPHQAAALTLEPANVVIVDEDGGTFACRLYIARDRPAPYGDKQRAVLYIEDEGISWMRGEEPVDVEDGFKVAAALGPVRVELF